MNEYQEKLKKLAEFLASDEYTDHKEIKVRMRDLNLKYSEDPIDQMNQVLLALHELKNSKQPQPNQEKHH